MDARDREVVFGFLLAGVWLDSAGRPTGDLALPEEGHHEGLLGAGAPATHQPDPACRQGAIWKRRPTLLHLITTQLWCKWPSK